MNSGCTVVIYIYISLHQWHLFYALMTCDLNIVALTDFHLYLQFGLRIYAVLLVLDVRRPIDLEHKLITVHRSPRI